MIYNIQTFCTYGYWPDTDLKPKSHKPIIAACDKCGKVRVTSKKDYSSLCQSCAGKTRYKNPEEREKQSKRQNKRYEDPEERKKTGEANKKSYKDDPTRSQRQGESLKMAHRNDPTLSQRQSKAQKERFENPEERKKTGEAAKKAHQNDPTIAQRAGETNRKRYSEMVDPGLEMCNYHIAYDFDQPEALTVKVTRSFHGQIHNPKGVLVSEKGYSLID